jgi:DNA-binding response OmpR family regulator
VCEHTELIEAIWLDPFGRTNNDVTCLVWGLRKEVEPDFGEPEFLKTEQGLGYSLKVKVVS